MYPEATVPEKYGLVKRNQQKGRTSRLTNRERDDGQFGGERSKVAALRPKAAAPRYFFRMVEFAPTIMASRKNDFRPQDAAKTLLWCRRICCLCGKKCGAAIEIAHIDRNGPGALDNAIPVCFECHSVIGHYADDHPRGKKFGIEELKKRRNQVYDEQTSSLVPPIDYRISQQNPARTLPGVGFRIHHLGGAHPVRAFVRVTISRGSKRYGPPPTAGHYDGRYGWNLNPGQHISGWFKLRKRWKPLKGEPLRAKVEITVADIYDYRHDLLPVGYILNLGAQDWYAEPCEEEM